MLKDPRCPVASGGDSETGKYHDQPVRAGKRRNSLGRSKDDANHAGSGSCSIRRELACGESFYARGLQGEGGTVVNLSGVVSSKPASSTDSVDLAGRAEAMALGGLGADTPLMPVTCLRIDVSGTVKASGYSVLTSVGVVSLLGSPPATATTPFCFQELTRGCAFPSPQPQPACRALPLRLPCPDACREISTRARCTRRTLATSRPTDSSAKYCSSWAGRIVSKGQPDEWP